MQIWSVLQNCIRVNMNTPKRLTPFICIIWLCSRSCHISTQLKVRLCENPDVGRQWRRLAEEITMFSCENGQARDSFLNKRSQPWLAQQPPLYMTKYTPWQRSDCLYSICPLYTFDIIAYCLHSKSYLSEKYWLICILQILFLIRLPFSTTDNIFLFVWHITGLFWNDINWLFSSQTQFR